jgi:hypothetical protein
VEEKKWADGVRSKKIVSSVLISRARSKRDLTFLGYRFGVWGLENKMLSRYQGHWCGGSDGGSVNSEDWYESTREIGTQIAYRID